MSDREPVLKNCFKIKQGLCVTGDAAVYGAAWISSDLSLGANLYFEDPNALLEVPSVNTVDLSASKIYSSREELISVPFAPDYLYTHPISVIDRIVFERAVFMDNDMYVSGESVFANTIDALSGVTLHSELSVGGSSTFTSSARFIDDVLMESDLDVNGHLSIAGGMTLSGGLTVFGPISAVNDLYVDGNVWFKGDNNTTLYIGSDDLDNVVFVSDVSSNILPDSNDTYDLGKPESEWRSLYVDDINATGVINAIGWSPKDANAVSWIDASDLSTVEYTVNTSCISSVTDRIDPNRKLTNTTTSSQPMSSVISNRHAMAFDGIDDNMYYTDSPLGSVAVSSSFVNIFILYRIEDTSINGVLFQNSQRQGGTAFQAHAPWGSGTCLFDAGGSSGHNRVKKTDWAENGEVMLAGFRSARGGQANLQEIWKNGELVAGDNSGVDIASGEFFSIGGVEGLLADQFATIGEVIITTDELTDDIRLKIEGYLAHKWNCESLLPADHPYKDRFVIDGNIEAAAVDVDGNISARGDLTTEGTIIYSDGVGTDVETWSKDDVIATRSIQTAVESNSAVWLQAAGVSNQLHTLTRGALVLSTPDNEREFIAIASDNPAGDAIWNDVSYAHAMVLPYNTNVKQIILRSTASQNADIIVGIHTNSGIQNTSTLEYKYFAEQPMEEVSNTYTYNNQPKIYTFNNTTSALAGETLGVSISASKPIGTTNISIVLAYNS